MNVRPLVLACSLALGLLQAHAQPAAATGRETAPERESNMGDTRALFDAAKQLFDDYAPEEVKKEYEFPSHEEWDAFAARLQRALEGGSLEELAAFEPEVRRALTAFRMLPDYGDYADWLGERLDLIETARMAVEETNESSTSPKRPTAPTSPRAKAEEPRPPAKESDTSGPVVPKAETKPSIPYYEVWLKRLQKRPAPSRADELVPLLKVIFSAEGLPAELAWLAEVESSLNPTARSPKGARGLFQLMPATAKSLGLSLLPFDERVHPGKNARAAARMLRRLHERFDSWPLALAAYNAGETRVAATLKNKKADSFAEIAEALPVETRMYVPKVFATVTVREKRDTQDLPPPRPPTESQARRNSRSSSGVGNVAGSE